MVYEFELGCNAEEATKNIGYVKGESTIDHSTLTRWCIKICLDRKNLNNQAKSQVGLIL